MEYPRYLLECIVIEEKALEIDIQTWKLYVIKPIIPPCIRRLFSPPSSRISSLTCKGLMKLTLSSGRPCRTLCVTVWRRPLVPLPSFRFLRVTGHTWLPSPFAANQTNICRRVVIVFDVGWHFIFEKVSCHKILKTHTCHL